MQVSVRFGSAPHTMMTRVQMLTTGLVLGLALLNTPAFAAETAELDKYIPARIDIGEMMGSFFSGGYGGGERPSPDQMQSMRDNINAKLEDVLGKHGLTLKEYREHSKDVFADDAAVKQWLEAHPDLKKRYEALPFDRMGRGGGSSGRGY
ncbi:MAG: hypothetical protein U0172_03005 [Nitrospiraceae bacterium]